MTGPAAKPASTMGKLLAILPIALALLTPSTATAATCTEFPSQAAAQRAANTVDADHDGVFCESLPCPCARPGSTSSPPASSPPPSTLPATFRGRCARGLRPDRRATCTPGAVFAGATAPQVCTPGYSTRVRSVSTPTKTAIYLAYGIRRHPPFAYEIDHLVSLELGGSNSPRNLWPQPEHTGGSYSAATKDRLENRLHTEVCSRTISLRTAQQRIRYWYLHPSG